MSAADSTTERTVDIGQRWWFRALMGALWLVVGVLVAVAIYSVSPGPLAEIPGYAVSGVAFGVLLFGVAYAGSRRWNRTSMEDGERRGRPRA